MSDILPVTTGDIPEALKPHVAKIADEAIQAAFHSIHQSFEDLGFFAWGDVAPDEAYVLDAVGEAFVGMVAANIDERKTTRLRLSQPARPAATGYYNPTTGLAEKV